MIQLARAPTLVAGAKGGSPSDLPNYQHPYYAVSAPRWKLCRDVMAGTEMVLKALEVYNPRYPKEQQADYDRRTKMAELYDGFRNTVVAGTGLVMAIPPVVDPEEASADFLEEWENIDGAGTHGTVFAKRALEEALITGLVGILIDYPQKPTDRPTIQDQREYALRPYWTMLRAEQIRNWRWGLKGSQTYLRQVTLCEEVETDDGMFGVGFIKQYRVFTNDGLGAPTSITFRVWQEQMLKDKLVFVNTDAGVVEGVTRIPVVLVEAGMILRPGEVLPPLSGLAYLCVSHYRVLSDRRYAMHIGCVPVPVRIGYQSAAPRGAPATAGQGAAYGPNRLMDIPVGGDFKWVAAPSDFMTPTHNELQALEVRMGNIGMAFLAPDPNVQQTATATRMNRQAQTASLQTVAQALEDAMEEAGAIHEEYRDGTVAPCIEVNTDYEDVTLDSATLTALSNIVTASNLTKLTFLKILKRGGTLPKGVEPEEELMAIQEEAAASQPVALMPGIGTPGVLALVEDEEPAPDDLGEIDTGEVATPPLKGKGSVPPPASGRPGRVARDATGQS